MLRFRRRLIRVTLRQNACETHLVASPNAGPGRRTADCPFGESRRPGGRETGSYSLSDRDGNRWARVADLHDEVDRHVRQHADRHVLDRRARSDRLSRTMCPLCRAQQRLALAVHDRHARRQRVAEDPAEVPQRHVERHPLVVVGPPLQTSRRSSPPRPASAPACRVLTCTSRMSDGPVTATACRPTSNRPRPPPGR